MMDTVVKRCTYDFHTADGRCCLPDGHDGSHQLFKADFVDGPTQKVDDHVAASLLNKESGPVSPDGVFVSRAQLSAIVATRRANRDSLWTAALRKHSWRGYEATVCVCGHKSDGSWASWVTHISNSLEDIRS
jgi:hypothetical protein